MRDFEKRFNRTRRLMGIFFVAVLAFIIGWWVLVGVVSVKVAKDPEIVGEKAGKVVKAFKDAVNDTTTDEATIGWERAQDEGYEAKAAEENGN